MDKSMSFNQLLEKDGSVSIHHCNIQKLAIELYKAKNNLSPMSMNEIFPDGNYNGLDLRSQTEFSVPHVNNVNHGQETLRFIGPKIWALIPDSLKETSSLTIFKNKIKKWVPKECPLQIMQTLCIWIRLCLYNLLICFVCNKKRRKWYCGNKWNISFLHTKINSKSVKLYQSDNNFSITIYHP